jgi:hypothetical protein
MILLCISPVGEKTLCPSRGPRDPLVILYYLKVKDTLFRKKVTFVKKK